MATLTITEDELRLSVSVTFDRWDGGDRAQYAYRIEADGAVAKGADLRMGSGAEPSDAEALATLLGFLGAFVESVRYGPDGDNRGLFPASLVPWAEAVDADMITLFAESLGVAV